VGVTGRQEEFVHALLAVAGEMDLDLALAVLLATIQGEVEHQLAMQGSPGFFDRDGIHGGSGFSYGRWTG